MGRAAATSAGSSRSRSASPTGSSGHGTCEPTAILQDSLGVYREVDGQPVHDFARIDAVLDRLLETGLRPIVELSFMPRDLARDPDRTVFAYGGIISPPRDWDRWTALVRELVAHLAERYGRDEVAEWAFEVWNEPNLGLFWDDAESAYLRLYDASAAAVKAVDPRFRVGGPATAAAAWVDDLLAHCAETGTPIDFVSTHTYGMPPLDLRPITARFGRPDLPLWWTEWGVSPSHGAALNDSPWGAPLVARGMRSGAGRLDAISYWVASDHFVELGEAEGLFHGGFGLLTIGNLRKPRFWAIAMLESLGTHEVAVCARGRRRGLPRRGVGLDRRRRTRGDRVLERDAGADEPGRRSAPRAPGRARDHGARPRRPLRAAALAGGRDPLQHPTPLGGAGRPRVARCRWLGGAAGGRRARAPRTGARDHGDRRPGRARDRAADARDLRAST